MERLVDAISKEGYEVVRTATPEDGLSLVQSDPSHSAILLDWDLPGEQVVMVNGLPATSIARTVADCCRLLSRFDAVALVDSALHQGLITTDQFDEITVLMARRPRCRTGRRVLHPMGYDAFGLPAENYAINTGVHPRKSTDESIAETAAATAIAIFLMVLFPLSAASVAWRRIWQTLRRLPCRI